ncbi:hypothetical protein H0H93_016147, partial [Arthromyces matolae]
MENKIPRSPRSVSPSSSVSGSPPTLSSDTLALLQDFLTTRAEEEKRFNDLADQAAARAETLAVNGDLEESDPPMMSVDEYRLAFGEDWQLSQFWYTSEYATRLAKSLRSICNPTSKIAFLCCPTAFVAFQHTNPLEGARLFEYDKRFAVLAPKKFVYYDLDEPDIFPEDLKGNVDVVLVDPPFLNEVTNKKVLQTIRQILHPTQGKLLLTTSTSIKDVVQRLYDQPPVGPMR